MYIVTIALKGLQCLGESGRYMDLMTITLIRIFTYKDANYKQNIYFENLIWKHQEHLTIAFSLMSEQI